ncbi:hypothetical protein RRG08_062710 [Elysia crispata]|uniref:Uncharacterized protein n=1 Tax=Elysia crispata TaxID=231223 RepID=A0AAE1DWI3_9GAST|nr:hypothetical protein RRG08_062710 [Elysia crispata]
MYKLQTSTGSYTSSRTAPEQLQTSLEHQPYLAIFASIHPGLVKNFPQRKSNWRGKLTRRPVELTCRLTSAFFSVNLARLTPLASVLSFPHKLSIFGGL